jgi:hypothetical protein
MIDGGVLARKRTKRGTFTSSSATRNSALASA